jgi:hypothetical protein
VLKRRRLRIPRHLPNMKRYGGGHAVLIAHPAGDATKLEQLCPQDEVTGTLQCLAASSAKPAQ